MSSTFSKIMFVLQIGSHEQSVTCNAEISGGRYGIVLLQYTKNKVRLFLLGDLTVSQIFSKNNSVQRK